MAKKFVIAAAMTLTCTLAMAAGSGAGTGGGTGPGDGTGGGGSIGSARPDDVTIGGIAASAIKYSPGANPQASGPNGGTSSFSSAFAASGSGSWVTLAQFGPGADNYSTTISTTLAGVRVDMSFDQYYDRSGGWYLANYSTDENLHLDLVFAMNGPGGNAAFLFDDFTFNANSGYGGTWNLNTLTSSGTFAGYDNLTLFARDASTSVTPDLPSPVPEPHGYALLALGLGVTVLMSRRRNRALTNFR